jgi:hypothetical protein
MPKFKLSGVTKLLSAADDVAKSFKRSIKVGKNLDEALDAMRRVDSGFSDVVKLSRKGGDVIAEMADGTTKNITKINKAWKIGKFADVFTELGFKMDDLEVKNTAKGLDEAFGKTKRGLHVKAMESLLDDLKKVDNDTLKAIEKVKNLDDLKKVIDDLGSKKKLDKTQFDNAMARFNTIKNSFPKGLEEFTDGLKKIDTPESPSWLNKLKDASTFKNLKRFRSVVAIAFLIWFAVDYFDFIKKVQDAMSGCFLNRGYNGGSCKVKTLTCDPSCLQSSYDWRTFDLSFGLIDDPSFSICKPCTMYSGSTLLLTEDCDFIPVLTEEECSCTDNNTNYLTGYVDAQDISITDVQNARVSHNSCSGMINAGTCPKKTKPDYANNIQPACPGIAGCISWSESCMENNQVKDGRCSKWCDDDYVVTKNVTDDLECRNVSFAAAVIASAPDPLNLLGVDGGLGGILRYLMIAGFAILCFLLLGLMYKSFKEDKPNTGYTQIQQAQPQIPQFTPTPFTIRPVPVFIPTPPPPLKLAPSPVMEGPTI